MPGLTAAWPRIGVGYAGVPRSWAGGGGRGLAPEVSGGCCGQVASALVFIRFHSKQKSPFHRAGPLGRLIVG